MKRLLLATTNPGKIAEIRRFLADLPAELVSPREVGIYTNPQETGTTLEENAVLKAKFYQSMSGLPALADDGGFEIDSLGGEPGVRSHRWIHGDRDDTDEDLIAYTFRRMEGVPEGQRSAGLRVVVALALTDGTIHTATAAVRGIIPAKPSDVRVPGFPYRSILYLPEIGKFYNHDALTPAETERYNHRKLALDQLKPILRASLHP